MKGIVITSHGPMAHGILETSKLFFGEQAQMKACCLSAEDNPYDFVDVLKEAVKEAILDGVIANDFSEADRLMREKASEMGLTPVK